MTNIDKNLQPFTGVMDEKFSSETKNPNNQKPLNSERATPNVTLISVFYGHFQGPVTLIIVVKR